MTGEVWEWLERLAARDTKVRAYLDCYRREYSLPSHFYPRVAIPPAGLVAIIELLIDDKERITKAYTDYASRIPAMPNNWPVLVVTDEFQGAERSIISASPNIYLRDFFRSFWRRLRRQW